MIAIGNYSHAHIFSLTIGLTTKHGFKRIMANVNGQVKPLKSLYIMLYVDVKGL